MSCICIGKKVGQLCIKDAKFKLEDINQLDMGVKMDIDAKMSKIKIQLIIILFRIQKIAPTHLSKGLNISSLFIFELSFHS